MKIQRYKLNNLLHQTHSNNTKKYIKSIKTYAAIMSQQMNQQKQRNHKKFQMKNMIQ